MFGYVTFNVKYYILSQMFYKKNWPSCRKSKKNRAPEKYYYLLAIPARLQIYPW